MHPNPLFQQSYAFTGDPAAARQGVTKMHDAALEAAKLQPEGADRMIVLLGRDAWPVPMPLVQEEKGWRFDTEAGIEELDDRRIGGNELAAIAALRTYVDAQVAYASEDRDGDRVREYAQRVLSSAGKRDGLYWPTSDDGAVSPLGPALAQADAYTKEFYRIGEPYHGYYFRILHAQGPNPPGGKYDYVINGNMIAGFAMLAWPADYDHSGVMTFVVNHQGIVYEKDLGPETAKLAEKMVTFDPDASWGEVNED